ncbi:hypothetical protein P43SY_009004 [Pythium insidiosum]|uniref:PHD-type domain-containing protein n=1 Tax=Pythium insidiosum TaxID=114742 RepID=A0AAD5M3Y1_PYTIN|nr:hypothetical protein P43SY_009004 [Pythium insidiosum]
MMNVVPVRIGDRYQAEIPALLPPDERRAQHEAAAGSTPAYRQQWSSTRFRDDEVTEFLRSVARLNEMELALRCLHEGDYDVNAGARLLQAARRRRVVLSRERRDALSDEDFEKALLAHGKRFFVIKQQYPRVAVADLVARFYDWKTSAAYARWRERLKARKNKEAARLRQWADPEPASDTSDFHNEYCELCFTGGQLLCCDGCERAYHFSCVSPPIKDVPMGDWFCDNCAAVLGTTLLLRASSENEHCSEAIVDGSSSDDASGPLTPDEPEDAGGSGSGSALASTDNSDSESGRLPRVKAEPARGLDSVVIKDEPMAMPMATTPPPLLSPPSRPSSASRPAVPSDLGSSSSSRKRQRKIVAPRRIPQPRLYE